MYGARYLTAHSSQAIERCRVAGGFVPLWRGSYAGDAEWTFLWHPYGAIAGQLNGEGAYWCGQTRQGRLVGVPGRACQPNTRPVPVTE